jgi:hypothetical protein
MTILPATDNGKGGQKGFWGDVVAWKIPEP